MKLTAGKPTDWKSRKRRRCPVLCLRCSIESGRNKWPLRHSHTPKDRFWSILGVQTCWKLFWPLFLNSKKQNSCFWEVLVRGFHNEKTIEDNVDLGIDHRPTVLMCGFIRDKRRPSSSTPFMIKYGNIPFTLLFSANGPFVFWNVFAKWIETFARHTCWPTRNNRFERQK